MESLIRKLSLIQASNSELWKESAIVAENVLMSRTRTWILVKALNGLLPLKLAQSAEKLA